MQITLVLENCETITFDYATDVFFFETSQLQYRYRSGNNGIMKETMIDGFTLGFRPNTGYMNDYFTDDNPVERLQRHTDVTQVVISHDDGTMETLNVSWEHVTNPTDAHDMQGIITTEKNNVVLYCESTTYKSELREQPSWIDIHASRKA